ncbi:MAG: ABC transporter ATP-binding protein [Eubacteriales bacterium]
MPYIEFQNVDKFFGSNHVLKSASLSIEKGHLVTLLGPSGCGKSTLLRCLAGLEEITSGRIILDGEDITTKPPQSRNIGMVFQQYSLFPNLNVFENIAFGLKMKKMEHALIENKVESTVRMVDLEGKEKQYPAQLSGGQQQRVALARSIVCEPKVLLLDEPLSAVDAKLRKSLQERIKDIQRELMITTVFVTHDQDEAMVMSDIIHLFNEGRIIQSGTPIDMYTAPKTNFAAGFIGHYNILTRDEFQKLVADRENNEGDIAIRPETIEISASKKEDYEGFYQIAGVVRDNTPHGNVLRYTVEANGIQLKADVLFRSFQLFSENQEVYLSIEKRNCLKIS